MISKAHYARILSCSILKVNVWFTRWLIFLGYRLVSPIFSITLWIWFGTTPSLNCRYVLMCVHTSYQPYGHPPFMLCSWQWAHRNPWCNSWHLCCHYARCWFPHGVRTTTCASFKHIQFLSSTNQHCVHQRWHFSWHYHCQPNTSDLLRQSCATQGFAKFDAVQAKKRNYYDRHPTNQFLPLAVKVFGCLHKQVDVFLHNCANAIWSLKEPKGPPLLSWFFWQKISITLQRLQASSILSRVVALGLTTSRLPPL